MTLAEWLSELRAAGVARVSLDLTQGALQPAPPHCSFPADQAPRPIEPNAQAESPHVHTEPADEADADQRARDLELMHSD